MEQYISWLTSPYAWAIAFFGFMLLELVTGVVLALLCGLGSLLTALALYSNLVTEPGYAVLTFLTTTVGLTVVLWKPLQRMMHGLKSEPTNDDVAPFIGDVGKVSDGPLTHTGGSIRLHGTRMNALLAPDAGVDSLPEDTSVIVRELDGQQRFIVTPANPVATPPKDENETT